MLLIIYLQLQCYYHRQKQGLCGIRGFEDTDFLHVTSMKQDTSLYLLFFLYNFEVLTASIYKIPIGFHFSTDIIVNV